MSNPDYVSDWEHEAAAIAAAAFAIISQEDLVTPKKAIEDRRITEENTKRTKSKIGEKVTDDTKISSDRSAKEVDSKPEKRATLEQTMLKESSANDKHMPKKTTLASPTLDQNRPQQITDSGPATTKKTPTFSDQNQPSLKKKTTFTDVGPRAKTTDITPSVRKKPSFSGDEQNGELAEIFPRIKKAPTFSDHYLNDNEGIKPEPTVHRTERRESKTSNSTSGKGGGNGLEDEKLAKIRRRYEKTKISILEWESRKKNKAKRRLERKERQLELKRARALQEYRNEISRIDKFASGARELAEERKRKDEAKAREKFDKTRLNRKNTPVCLFC